MLKSNSNQLTFENEIQNLRNQRENQFKKPTYAEITSKNIQDELPIPPLLPIVENVQQMNNELQIRQVPQEQQRMLPNQKSEIKEQTPEYQLNMIETEDVGVQTDSYVSDEQSLGNLETESETETSTDEDGYQRPSTSLSRSSLDSDDSISTSNRFEVLNLDETENESSESEKSENTDGSKDSSESNEIDSESAKKETVHRRKKRKTKKKAGAHKCTKCEDVTCKKAWDSDLETEKKERQRKNKVEKKTKDEDQKEKNPMFWFGSLSLKQPTKLCVPRIGVLHKEKKAAIYSIKKEESLGYASARDMTKWPNQVNQTQILQQPFKKLDDDEEGEKYRIAIILGSGKSSIVCAATIDCGSFTSCISKRLYNTLNEESYRIQTMTAKSAKGLITIRKKVNLKVNLGPYMVEMPFSIIEDPDYQPDLILIGSEFIKKMDCTMQLKTKSLWIEGKYHVPLHTDEKSITNHMRQIKNTMMMPSGVDVGASKAKILNPGEKATLSIILRPGEPEKLQMSNFGVFGRQAKNDKLHIPDIFIPAGYDLTNQPVIIEVRNISNAPINIANQKLITLTNVFDDTIDKSKTIKNNKTIKEHQWNLNIIQKPVNRKKEHPFDFPNNTYKDTEKSFGIFALQNNDDTESEDEDWDEVFDENNDLINEYENILMSITKKRKRQSESEEDSYPFTTALAAATKCDENKCTSTNAELEEGANGETSTGRKDQIETEAITADKWLKSIDDMDNNQYFYIPHSDIPFNEEELVKKLKENTDPEDPKPKPITLPEHIKNKINLIDEKVDPQTNSPSKLVLRPWSQEDESEWLKIQQERRQYYTDMGRDEMMKKITWGRNITPEWKTKFEDVIWEYRDCYGMTLRHVSVGVKYYSLKVGTNGKHVEPAKFRSGTAFASKLTDRIIDMHTRAGLIEIGSGEPYGNSYCLAKPKIPIGERIKTIQDLENATDEELTKQFRFVIDLSRASKKMSNFAAPLPKPRSILTNINAGDYYVALDLLTWYHQIYLDEGSRQTHSFLSTNSNQIKCSTRAVMGSNPSGGGGAVITGQNWPFLKSSYMDNLYNWDPSIPKLLADFIRTHEVARAINAVFKLTDSVILASADDGAFEILGMIVKDGKLTIPRKKIDALAALPRSKKFIIKLISSVSYYGCFSNAFADLLCRIRDELKSNGTKFKLTPKLERLIYALLYMLRYNTGLHLLTKSQIEFARYCLFVDASAKATGCVLTAIIDQNILVPIFSSSKCLPKNYRSHCSNYAELFGLGSSLASVAQIIGNKEVIVATDSAYVEKCFSTMELTAIPQRLRALVIDIKINYNIAVVHLPGESNFTADLLSRFFIPCQTGVTSRQQVRKLLKFHMKPAKLTEKQQINFMAMYDEALKKTSWKENNECVDRIRNDFPCVYSIYQEPKCGYMSDECQTCPQLPGTSQKSIKEEMFIDLMNQPETISKRKILSIERNLGIKTSEIDENKCDKPGEAKAEKKKKTSKNQSKTKDKKVKEINKIEDIDTEMLEEKPVYSTIDALESDFNLMTLENEKVSLTDNDGTVRTIHRVNDEIINRAKTTCDPEAAKRIATADYVIIQSKNAKIKPLKITIQQKQQQPIIMETDTTKQDEIDIQEQASNLCHNNENQENKRTDQETTSDSERPIEESEQSDIEQEETKTSTLDNNDATRKNKRLHETESEGEKNKGPVKNQKTSIEPEEVIISEPRTRSKTKMENELDKIDKETSFIIIMDNETENSGTNELLHTDSGIEVIRNNEYQPPDKIHQIVNSLRDFNEDEIPVEGNETEISGENKSMEPARLDNMDEDQDVKMTDDNDILNLDDQKDQSINDLITKEQQNCPETKEIIDKIKAKTEPTRDEIKSKTDYSKDLLQSYKSLKVINNRLHKVKTSYNGRTSTVLVVPPAVSELIIKRIHQQYMHQAPWKLQKFIINQYHIHNIKQICRTFKCTECDLALKPALQSTRKLPVTTSTVAEEAQCDILSLIPAHHDGITYQYVLMINEVATGFVFTEKLQNRTATHVTEALFRSLDNASFTPKYCTFDEAKEFQSEIMKSKLASRNIQPIYLSFIEKNSMTAEGHIARLNDLLRRALEQSKSWPASLPAATLALNSALRRYHTGENTIQSPCFLFNGREAFVTMGKDENDFDAAEAMKAINKARYCDTLSLIQAVNERKSFKQGELILVHREFIRAAKKLGCKTRKLKIEAYWTTAKVIKQIDDQNYLVALKSGTQRKIHRRECRKICDDLLQQYKQRHENG